MAELPVSHFPRSDHIDLDRDAGNVEENALLLGPASVSPEDPISNIASDDARPYDKQMALIAVVSQRFAGQHSCGI